MVRLHFFRLILGVTLLCGACGVEHAVEDRFHDLTNPPNAATPPGNSLNGTLSGQPLVANSAIYAVSYTAQNLAKNVTLVVLSDQNALCDHLTARTITPQSTLTALYLDGTSPGIFSANAAAVLVGRQAVVETAHLDAHCQDTLNSNEGLATNGFVDVTRVDTTASPDSQAFGQFSVTMGPQNANVSGTFQATYCPALENMEQVLTMTGLAQPAGQTQLSCQGP